MDVILPKGKKEKSDGQGQALLIVLLVVAVGLTIGLSVVSRTITDVRVSRQEEEAARAFSVAEAGIEEALRTGVAPVGGVTIDGITADVTQADLGNSPEFVYPERIEQGDIQTLWLVSHNPQGVPDPTYGDRYDQHEVHLYWGNPGQAQGDETTPALEVSVYYQQGGNFLISRGAFDPNSGRNNGFDSAEVGPFTVGGQSFQFRKQDFRVPGTPYALRLKLLYNDQSQALAVESNNSSESFPLQGTCYEAKATITDSGVSRKVKRCQFYPSPPEIFDYLLFSEGDLVK